MEVLDVLCTVVRQLLAELPGIAGPAANVDLEHEVVPLEDQELLQCAV